MKKLFKELKKSLQCDLSKMGMQIGMGRFSLARSIRNDTLKIKDLRKCIEASGEKLVIRFKGQDYEI